MLPEKAENSNLFCSKVSSGVPHPTSRRPQLLSPVLTGFPWPLGQGAFSGRKGRTSCCRGGPGPPGRVLGARSLPGRNEGGDGPESRGDPQPPAAPGPAVERPRALQPHPEAEGPPGGSAPGQPHRDPRPGVAEINPAARGGQASPFFRLLADAPDIVAKRSLS